MKKWLLFAVFAAGAWGNYGVAARGAGDAFHHHAEWTFLMVCAAYALLGIPFSITPKILGKDHGLWTKPGAVWGIGAGLCGAVGALCVIWAIAAGGVSTAVMALVFGLAQLFNFLFSWWLAGKFSRPANVWFWASLPVIMLASWGVQQFRPGTTFDGAMKFEPGWWLLFTLGTALCWGGYGVCARTALAKTKASPKDHGSHFIPLFWVSCTYAVFGVGTLVYIAVAGKPDVFTAKGAGLGLLTGLAGLLGAAFVIPANGVKGSPGPGTVMAVVFACAAGVNAVCNTLVYPPKVETLIAFWVSLATLAVSALIFARNNPTQPPKPAPPQAPPVSVAPQPTH